MALGLSCIGLISGCLSSTNLQVYQPKDEEESRVVSSLRRIPNGINSRSVDLLMQAYADDVYVANFHKYMGVAGPTAPLSLSKADLREAYTQMFRAVKDVSMEVKDFRVVSVSGDRAVAEASTELIFKFEVGRGESRKGDAYRNDVTWRLRRTPAGWKIVEEVWQ